MPSTYYSLITNTGAAKLVAAQAANVAVQLSDMAFGDGGGAVYDPTADQTELVNQRYIAGLTSITVHETNANWLVIEGVIPVTEGGWHVREVGIYDIDDDLIAIAKFPETYKPLVASGAGAELKVQIILVVSNTDTVELTSSGFLQEQSDWTEASTTSVRFIRNKPAIPPNTSLRSILASIGLSGGGQLNIDRTLGINWPGLSAATLVALTDLLALWQTDGSTHRKATVQQLLDAIITDDVVCRALNWKAPVRVVHIATIADLAAGAPLTVDGQTLVANDRILYAPTAGAVLSGLYVCTVPGSGANGTWVRTGDANTSGKMPPNTYVPVSQGTAFADSLWQLTTNGPITLGTTTLLFAKVFPVDNFVASGASHKSGLVPTPGASAGTTKALHEDGTWKVPQPVPTTFGDIGTIVTVWVVVGGHALTADNTLNGSNINAAAGANASWVASGGNMSGTWTALTGQFLDGDHTGSVTGHWRMYRRTS